MAFKTSVGTTTLPDVGKLSYNGVIFSSLFKSKATINDIKDEAQRTVKYLELRITAEGAVVMNPGETSIDNTMAALLINLGQQGGVLTYSGRGLGPIVINAPGNPLRDVAWGPVPEVIDFQPLGNAGSAMVSWQVTTRIPATSLPLLFGGKLGGAAPVLQFNEETTVSYDDEDYSSLSIRGTLEIPLTRVTVNSRVVSDTVDSFRQRFMTQIADSIDLTRFRVSRRTFNVSRDKRTMQWEFQADELPPMGLPYGAPHARGTMSVRPMKRGPALVRWICSLKCTYTIRKNFGRQLALANFMALMRWRMLASADGNIAGIENNGAQGQNPRVGGIPSLPSPVVLATQGNPGLNLAARIVGILKSSSARPVSKPQPTIRCLIQSFGFDEGLYLDSKTISFESSWLLITTISHIMLGSGCWTWPVGSIGGRIWAQSVADISGWKGNERNLLDPAGEVIVDLGTNG